MLMQIFIDVFFGSFVAIAIFGHMLVARALLRQPGYVRPGARSLMTPRSDQSDGMPVDRLGARSMRVACMEATQGA